MCVVWCWLCVVAIGFQLVDGFSLALIGCEWFMFGVDWL